MGLKDMAEIIVLIEMVQENTVEIDLKDLTEVIILIGMVPEDPIKDIVLVEVVLEDMGVMAPVVVLGNMEEIAMVLIETVQENTIEIVLEDTIKMVQRDIVHIEKVIEDREEDNSKSSVGAFRSILFGRKI